MDDSKRKDRAEYINSLKKLSRDWMRDSFYPQWEKAYQNYKAEPDIKLDENGKPDPEVINLSSPITFASSRRTVARMTAQIPHFKFRSSEKAPIAGAAAPITLAELIGRTLMYQWDHSGMQRTQKKHALQAVLLGWSPRLWYWLRDIQRRKKRVDISQAAQDPATLQQIAATYEIDPAALMEIAQAQEGPDGPPILTLLSNILAKNGRGGLLPIKYDYLYYEGPKADFTFAGDCCPEPHFQSLRDSKRFIVNKFRDFSWLKSMAQQYKEELGKGIEDLIEKYPKGTENRFDSQVPEDEEELMSRLLGVINRSTQFDTGEVKSSEDYQGEWRITEHHCASAGREDAYLEYSYEGVYIGRIDYPYDLAGRFAITDCVLIDDLVSGIGDSTARVMRGLHKVHSDQLGYRSALIENLLRPLIGTNSRELMDNPEAIKKLHGFRMFYARDPGQIWQQQEMASLAAAQAGIANDSSMMQLFYMFSGENSMSLMASVDPGQTRTAAGVNFMANQLDVLTKDLLDSYLQSSLNEDAWMMWMLNRSELADVVNFDASQYNRAFQYQEEAWKENWVRAEPLHFQVDGEITVQPGSTLAEDEAAQKEEARYLFEIGSARPDLVNPMKARDSLLIAFGRRHEMKEWMPEPAPPQEPEIKQSVSITIPWEKLEPSMKAGVSEKIPMLQAPEGQPPEGLGGPQEMPMPGGVPQMAA